MDTFEHEVDWTERSYSLREVLREYASKLPIIIDVTEGYDGDTAIETLSSGEILRLHTCDSQKRVMAKGGDGKYYSIPMSHPRPFQPLLKSQAPPDVLKNLIASYGLPLRVRHLCPEKTKALLHESLLLESVYSETFFKGNSIIKGKLLEYILVFPVYLQIKVAIAKCFKSGNIKAWENLNALFDETTKGLKFEDVDTMPEINVYSDIELSPGDDEYDYIQPETYITLSKQRKIQDDGSIGDPIQDTGMKNLDSQLPHSSEVYEDIPPIRSSSSRSPLQSVRSNKKDKQQRKHLPSSASGAQVNPPVPPPRRSPPVISSDLLHRNFKPREPIPTPPTSSKSVSGMWQNLKKIVKKRNRRCEGMNPTENADPKDEGITNSSYNSDPGLYEAISNLHVDSDNCDINTSGQSKPLYSSDWDMYAPITSVDEIPADILPLSCRQIADCLKLLHLEEYVDTFLENQVNGALLMTVERNMLENQFKMDHFKALKLYRFARFGWRPL